jgi:hypothetical protein
MYRPAPRPLTLVFPTRALPLKDDSAIASRSETMPLLLIGAARQCTPQGEERLAECPPNAG